MESLFYPQPLFFAQAHQAGHFFFGENYFLAAPGGKGKVGDFEIILHSFLFSNNFFKIFNGAFFHYFNQQIPKLFIYNPFRMRVSDPVATLIF